MVRVTNRAVNAEKMIVLFITEFFYSRGKSAFCLWFPHLDRSLILHHARTAKKNSIEIAVSPIARISIFKVFEIN